MADMRKYAGGGPEAGGHDQAKRPTAFGGMAVDYSSGFATLVPTPEEARRAQEAARRAQSLVEQSVSGCGGSAEDLHRAAREEAARQLAAEPLSQSMYGQAQGVTHVPRAPGALFSRETFLAILRAKQAECRSPRRMGQTPDGLLVLAELTDIFENLE